MQESMAVQVAQGAVHGAAISLVVLEESTFHMFKCSTLFLCADMYDCWSAG